MESPPREVVVLYTTVSDAGPLTPTTGGWFRVTGIAAKLWLTYDPPFAPGDRVRITITKEPAIDKMGKRTVD